MARSDDGMQQLARALELLAQHRLQPRASDAGFLAAHADLRELLEPLLASEPAEDSGSVQLGDYRLVRELGRGGMGIVHEAVQVSLGRRVALKVLPDHRGASPSALARFRREAELTARLRHDHLVPVFAVGEAAGVHYLAMELVTGCSLASVLHRLQGQDPRLLHGSSLAEALGAELGDPSAGAMLRGRSHLEAVLRTVLPLAEALAYAHAQGIVHRDVKPANVLLRPDGTPLLTDFGLARDLDSPGLTRTGDFAGTPHYMAPEQIESRSGVLDGRADVFALGVVLYELLTLRRPFEAESTEAVIVRVLRANPLSLQRQGLRPPADLLAVLDKAMQKRPADRYASMAAFAADLRALLEFRPVSVSQPGALSRLRRYSRREPLRATLAAVLALGVPALLGLGGYLLSQRSRIAAATELEQREQVEALWEAGYLELGEGNLAVAVQRFRTADGMVPDQPETCVGLVLAFDELGEREAAAAQRQRLAGEPAALRQELLGLVSDLVTAEAKGAPVRPPELESAPRDALGCYVRGMRWLTHAHDTADLGDYRIARRWLQEAIERAPVARALYHCQYLHVLTHLQEPTAIRSFARVVEDLWPRSPIVRYWLGFALEVLEPERAAQLQREVIAARPDLALPYASLARIHEQHDAWQEARGQYERVLAILPEEPRALVGLSRCLVHLGKAEQALAAAERIRRAAPLSHLGLNARASALLELGREEEALADAQQATAMSPGDAEAFLLLARAHLALHEPEAALQATARAAALVPADSEPHVLAAHAHRDLGQSQLAARSLEEVVQRQPARANAWCDLGWLRHETGDDDGAGAAFARAAEHGAEDAVVQLSLGNWCKQRLDLGEAERHYLRAIELDPKLAQASVNLGALRWPTDRPAATQYYREAVAAAPDLEPASEGLAWVLEQQGQMAEAAAERTRWAEAHPQSPVAWLKLASSLVRQPDWPAALAAVERAAAAAPAPRADVQYWRGEVLRRRGDPAEAWRPFFVEARAIPDCSKELRQRIDERLEAPK